MKRIFCLLMSIMLILGSINIVFASSETTGTTGGVNGLVESAWNIVGTVAWCGYAVALGMMIFIGIKYMLGAADAKANMKAAISNYLIGAALVFSASTIALVVANLAMGGDSGDSLATSIIDSVKKIDTSSENSEKTPTYTGSK